MSSPPAADEAGGRSRRPRRAGVIVAALAVVVVVVVAVVLLRGSGGGDLPEGPLKSANEAFVGTSKPIGREFATGFPLAVNRGDRDAVIERMDLVGVPAGLEVLKSFVSGPKRTDTIAMDLWPDPGFSDLHKPRGFVLEPAKSAGGRRGASLVFVMRMSAPKRYVVDGVDVTYTVGDERYRTRIKQGFAVCGYRGKLRVQPCALPDE